MGVNVDFDKEETKWTDDVVPFHPMDWFQNKDAMRKILTTQPLRVASAEAHSVETKAAQCNKADLNKVTAKQKHLAEEQRQQLREVFERNKELFSGKTGKHPREFHIELKPDAEPFCQMRPCPVSHQTWTSSRRKLTGKTPWASSKRSTGQLNGACQCLPCQSRKTAPFEQHMTFAS